MRVVVEAELEEQEADEAGRLPRQPKALDTVGLDRLDGGQRTAVVRDDVVRAEHDHHAREVDGLERARRVEVQLGVDDLVEVERQTVGALDDARQHLGLVEVAAEHEVDVPAPQQVVERADVGSLEIDPGEDGGVVQLAVEVPRAEGPGDAGGRVEADPVKRDVVRGRGRARGLGDFVGHS